MLDPTRRRRSTPFEASRDLPRWTRPLAGLVALAAGLLVLLAPAGPARADTAIALSSLNDVQDVNANFNLLVDYTLDGGTYTDWSLAVHLPRYVTVVAHAEPAWQTYACVTEADLSKTCTWTAASLDSGSSITSQNSLTLRLDNWRWPDGTLASLDATLTALYATPSAPDPVPITLTASRVVEAQAIGAMRWQTAGLLNQGTWIAHALEPTRFGKRFTLAYRLNNNGDVGLDDLHMEVVLPPGVTFIEARSSSDAVLAVAADPSLVAWQEIGTAGNRVVTADYIGTFATAYSPYLYVDLWVSCDVVPTGLELDYPAAYSAQASATATEPTSGVPIAHALASDKMVIPTDASSGDACLAGEVFSKAHYGGVGVDVNHTWDVKATPAKGLLPIYDALVVDALPAGTTFLAASGPTPADFSVYSCILPADPSFGADETTALADFLAYVASGDCALGVDPDATHLALYAPVWGSVEDGIVNLSTRITTQVPRDYLATDPPGENPVVNRAWLTATPPFGDRWSAAEAANATLVEGSHPVVKSYVNHALPGTRVLRKGESGRASFYLGRDANFQALLNPSVTVVAPPEVVIDSVTTVINRTGSACVAAGPVAEDNYTAPATLTGPFTWQFGNVTEPWLMYAVYSSVCIYLDIAFTVPEDIVLIDGQQLLFTASITADDVQETYTPAVVTQNFTMSVLGEIRASVTPECQDDPPPAFRVTSSNTGGTALTDIVTTVAVPTPADGISTATGVYAGLADRPADATFEFSDDGGASWVAEGVLANEDVTHVRMLHPGIAPLSPSLSFLLLVAPLETEGELRARAIMTASPLGLPSDSQFSDAFVLGSCPGQITLASFWDPNRDGVRETDDSEPLLDGWSIEITDDLGATTLVTGSSATGTAFVELAPGDYTVAEVLPTGTAGSWLTPVGGLVRALTVTEYGDVLIPFGNSCLCADPDAYDCQIPTCEPDGTCPDVPADDGASCDDQNACTTPDACLSGACVPGAPLDCDDSDVCTDDTCLPASGCAHTQNTAPCDDGSACTTDDTCAAGVCVGGAPPDCDDGNVCTDDSCVPATGCAHAANTLPCDDSVFCNGVDVCAGGTCVSPGDPCTSPALAHCNEADDRCDACAADGDCADDANVCTVPHCADGTCDLVPGRAGAVCRAADGDCDLAESCDGTTGVCPTDAYAAAGTACGDGTTTTCDAPDTCDGNKLCLPNWAPATTPCRPVAGLCDVAEICDGAGACPADAYLPATAVCRAATAPCDAEERCTGAAATCPADLAAADGTSCADADRCNGDETCQGGSCAAGVPLACDNGAFCDGLETCDAAAGCLPGLAPDLDDGLDCTVDSCDEATDSVLHTPDATRCDDGLACTLDACVPPAGCVATPNDAACPTAGGCDTARCTPSSPQADAEGCVIAPFAPEPVACGVDACAARANGQTTCTDGVYGDTCDPLWDAIPDTQCAPDDAEITVMYLVVSDLAGTPIGSVRCFQYESDATVACEHEPDSTQLVVYPELLCPGVEP